MDLSKIDDIVKKYNFNEREILPILQDIQKEYNYLPLAAMEKVCEKLKVTLAEVSSIATFYSGFSLKPRGKYIISMCIGTACHVRGAPRILDEIERQLGIKNGETTSDGEFTIETVSCIGACALGPVVVINGDYHGNITTAGVEKMLNQYRNNK